MIETNSDFRTLAAKGIHFETDENSDMYNCMINTSPRSIFPLFKGGMILGSPLRVKETDGVIPVGIFSPAVN